MEVNMEVKMEVEGTAFYFHFLCGSGVKAPVSIVNIPCLRTLADTTYCGGRAQAFR